MLSLNVSVQSPSAYDRIRLTGVLLAARFGLLRRTPAEIAAVVTPTDATYIPGNPLRHGADETGATSAVAVLQTLESIGREIIVDDGDFLIDDDLTLTVPVRMFKGGRFLIATGKTLTISGDFRAGFHQVFSCTGTGQVKFTRGAVKETNPLWWQVNTTPGTTNMQPGIQAAVYAAWYAYADCFIPAGEYFVGTASIKMPVPDVAYEYRGDAFRLYGAGAGPVFVRTLFRGTTLVSDENRPILRWEQYLGELTASGHYYIEGIRFEGDSTQPVVQFDNFGEYSWMRDCEIFQAGAGSGIRFLEFTKATLERCNILNRDWATGVDAECVAGSRTGNGVESYRQYNAGLLTIKKVTARGFNIGFAIGVNGLGSGDLSAARLEQCESSIVNKGVYIESGISGCKVEQHYFEGITGTVVQDKGSYTKVRDCFCYTGTFSVGIDGGYNTQGNVYDGNFLETDGEQNCTLISVNSEGFGKTVSNNTLRTVANTTGVVVGLEITGASPNVQHHGNSYDPAAVWTGASGTARIKDSSTGRGNTGFVQTEVGDETLPTVGRGVLTLGRAVAALGDAAFSGGVLTVGKGSFYNLTLTGAQVITSISGLSQDGKVCLIRATNGNATFNNSSTLKLNNGTALVGPCSLLVYLDNGVVYEIGRGVVT